MLKYAELMIKYIYKNNQLVFILSLYFAILIIGNDKFFKMNYEVEFLWKGDNYEEE